MKNLPLNEKHLADKLQNVPVPDVNQSWEQMRKLLDREQPEPVAGAWSGNRKWWWMGITALIVMIAAWLANPFKEGEGTKQTRVAVVPGKVDNVSKKTVQAPKKEITRPSTTTTTYRSTTKTSTGRSR